MVPILLQLLMEMMAIRLKHFCKRNESPTPPTGNKNQIFYVPYLKASFLNDGGI